MYVVYKSYFPYKNIMWYICILMMVSVVNKNYTLTSKKIKYINDNEVDSKIQKKKFIRSTFFFGCFSE